MVTLTEASKVFPLFQHAGARHPASPSTEFIYMLAGKMV
jgi:hypothetical protein